jgi:hypothetical protein
MSSFKRIPEENLPAPTHNLFNIFEHSKTKLVNNVRPTRSLPRQQVPAKFKRAELKPIAHKLAATERLRYRHTGTAWSIAARFAGSIKLFGKSL